MATILVWAHLIRTLSSLDARVVTGLFRMMRLTASATRWLAHDRVAAGVVTGAFVLGLFLRAKHFVGDRSAWVDEAMVLESLFTRSFAGLLAPLEHQQMAPYGWLWAERLAIEIAGSTVAAARIFPLFCGIASLVMFAWLAWRHFHLRAWEAAFSVFVIAMFEPFIYFSAEVKHYGTDVLASVCILAIFAWLQNKPRWTSWQTLALAAFGALVVWFSHPAAFALSALGLALVIERWQRRDWHTFNQLIFAGLAWVLSFAAVYALSMSDPVAAFKRAEAFPGRFAPIPPTSQADFLWYYDAIRWLFDALGFAVPGLAVVLLLAGCIELARRNRYLAICSLLPLPIVVLASGAHLYPFWHRLLLFLGPGIALSVAAGIGAVFDGGRSLRPVAVAAALLMALFPAAQSWSHAYREPPFGREEIKPLLADVAAHGREGDVFFVAFGAQLGMKIHSRDFPALSAIPTIFGAPPRSMSMEAYAALMSELSAGQRVFALFITNPITQWRWNEIDEYRAFEIFAKQAGARVDFEKASEGALLRQYSFDESIGSSTRQTESKDAR